jgi:hypothetical protein
MREHTFRQGKCTRCGVTYFDVWSCEEAGMARLIEIKGLGADIASVKQGIGELRAAAAELNVEKSGLTAEIKDLTSQIKEHRADLRFEAETLGNSSGNTVARDDAAKAVADALEPEAPLSSDSAGAESGR